MNWNTEPPEDVENVIVLLEDGSIKQAWWNYIAQHWHNVGVYVRMPIEGTVIGWLTIDDYIQQTQALAQPGAFVGKWEVEPSDGYNVMDYIIFGDNEYYCNLSAALEVVERMRK